jgi:hypothetical protein
VYLLPAFSLSIIIDVHILRFHWDFFIFYYSQSQVPSDKAYQLLAHGRWFSPASTTTKTGRHDIAVILIAEGGVKHQKSKQSIFFFISCGCSK